MKLKIRSAFASTLAVALLSSGVAGAPSAQAVDGTNSLAAVLTAKSSYDTDKSNYDILTAAVLAVLQEQ